METALPSCHPLHLSLICPSPAFPFLWPCSIIPSFELLLVFPTVTGICLKACNLFGEFGSQNTLSPFPTQRESSESFGFWQPKKWESGLTFEFFSEQPPCISKTLACEPGVGTRALIGHLSEKTLNIRKLEGQQVQNGAGEARDSAFALPRLNRNPAGNGCLEEKKRECLMNADIVFTSGTELWGPTFWELLNSLRVST